MTHDQAKQILRHCGGNVQLNEDGTPDWRVDLVVMDGVFSVDELRAVLWFAEREEVGT
jgi:hypothetical protein